MGEVGAKGPLIGIGIGLGLCVLVGSVYYAFSAKPDISDIDKNGTYHRIASDAAGQWETVARDGECTWQRWNSPDDQRAAEVGTVEPGQRGVAELREGDYFVTYGCDAWRLVG